MRIKKLLHRRGRLYCVDGLVKDGAIPRLAKARDMGHPAGIGSLHVGRRRSNIIDSENAMRASIQHVPYPRGMNL
jgi:hypothetical protein